MKYAIFERFEIGIKDDDAAGASHQGPCDDDVMALSKAPYIASQLSAIDPDQIRAELNGYGAWDDTELADHEQNLQRILWIAAGNIREDT